MNCPDCNQEMAPKGKQRLIHHVVTMWGCDCGTWVHVLRELPDTPSMEPIEEDNVPF